MILWRPWNFIKFVYFSIFWWKISGKGWMCELSYWIHWKELNVGKITFFTELKKLVLFSNRVNLKIVEKPVSAILHWIEINWISWSYFQQWIIFKPLRVTTHTEHFWNHLILNFSKHIWFSMWFLAVFLIIGHQVSEHEQNSGGNM